MQGSLRFDLYKFWNKQVRFASISKTKPRSKLRSAFVWIVLTLLLRRVQCSSVGAKGGKVRVQPNFQECSKAYEGCSTAQ